MWRWFAAWYTTRSAIPSEPQLHSRCGRVTSDVRAGKLGACDGTGRREGRRRTCVRPRKLTQKCPRPRILQQASRLRFLSFVRLGCKLAYDSRPTAVLHSKAKAADPHGMDSVEDLFVSLDAAMLRDDPLEEHVPSCAMVHPLEEHP